MKRTEIQKLSALQQNTANIRNICILAHVDHGKTTLTDGLVASNGIISQRMAGKLRYLDSREDEQLRGITMKASAISLRYERDSKEYLINLIDSPGHIDFSSEVSTAVRLCDGAVVLVDVVEGVCPQTHAVLRQAWLENIRPVLVLNKIDRLVVELRMTPSEAYRHLLQILEQVNAITGELFTSDVLAKMAQNTTTVAQNSEELKDQVFDWSSGIEDSDDSQLYFCPDQGNVVFASAGDGWGFRLDQFAEMYARKVGVSAPVLKRTLWGDFYVDTKAKCVKKGAQAKGKTPLFVQLILDNIWTVYDAVLIKRDKEMISKIVRSLNLKSMPGNTDARAHLQSLFNQWLPISHAVLAMVCDQLPSPQQISPERVENLLGARLRAFDSLPPATQQLKNDFLTCSSSDTAPVIVFVSKMFPTDAKSLPQNRAKPLTAEQIAVRREALKQRLAEKAQLVSSPEEMKADRTVPATENGIQSGIQQLTIESPASSSPLPQPNEDDQVFIAFARVYSGTVRRGQRLYVLGPKHNPGKALQHMSSFGELDSSAMDIDHVGVIDVGNLYMFMGRELEPLDEVPVGNILGIGGLEEYILKSASLSSTLACPAFTDMHLEATPIVRVAVEPRHMGDMNALVRGMKLLNQSDPIVEILVQETGDLVVIAAGEVHLQKCLDDLRQKFARIEIDVSDPIVPFRETVIVPPTVDRVNELIQCDTKPVGDSGQDNGSIDSWTKDRRCNIRIRAVPLPDAVTKLLSDNVQIIKAAEKLSAAGSMTEKSAIMSRVGEHVVTELQQLREKLMVAFHEAAESNSFWADAVERIWSFSRNGTNILVNCVEGYARPSLWSALEGYSGPTHRVLREFDSAIVSGFHIATQAGPLCEEPMMGVCFAVERWDLLADDLMKTLDDVNNTQEDEHEEPAAQNDELESLASDISDTRQQMDLMKCSQFAGQLISSVKDGCRRAFQAQPQRLMWAMYTCVIQATADVLGKMYAVLGKRNGRVLNDEMREGSSIFNVTAVLPVVESFGFAEEIRKRTSGLASPQLKFTHWEVIGIDPFWVPTTAEEYLHYGEKADSENIARRHMNAIRRRKGLHVNEKIVEFAEKQRTLKKNK